MERINSIFPVDRNAQQRAQERWDSIAKPIGSFGKLEDAVCRIAAVQKTENIDISRRCAVIMCGDHGVTAEGVTQCGSGVTASCAADIAAGRANVNAVAAPFNTDVIAVDVGIASDVECPGLICRKVAYGTSNMTMGPAMTCAETEAAVKAGMDIAGQLKNEGYSLVVAGEMGIGNTTSASAVASVLLGLPAEQVTGRGAGLTSDGLQRKIRAVKKAVAVNKPDRERPLELLGMVGGLEIAAMTGLFLGAAYYGITAVVDGVISAAAAAVAYLIQPLSAQYMLASHCSGEPAGEGLLKLIGLSPVIDAGLRLGEGTGGVLLIPLLDGAVSLYNNARLFSDTNIERYSRLV